jgi:hypothetical protein
MNDCEIIIDDNTEIVDISINDNIDNINVNIDNSSPNIQQFISSLNNLNIIYSLSAKWQETSYEMDTIQDALSAKWQETAYEMDTIQDPLSANWEYAYNSVKLGIIDGGFC